MLMLRSSIERYNVRAFLNVFESFGCTLPTGIVIAPRPAEPACCIRSQRERRKPGRNGLPPKDPSRQRAFSESSVSVLSHPTNKWLASKTTCTWAAFKVSQSNIHTTYLFLTSLTSVSHSLSKALHCNMLTNHHFSTCATHRHPPPAKANKLHPSADQVWRLCSPSMGPLGVRMQSTAEGYGLSGSAMPHSRIHRTLMPPRVEPMWKPPLPQRPLQKPLLPQD
jgi:hypothetical protein